MLNVHTTQRIVGMCLAALITSAASAAGGGRGDAGYETCLSGKMDRALAATKAFDEETGRDLRHYPPDRIVDFLHMTLDMRFEDLNDAGFTASQMLRFSPIAEPLEALTLDAVGLDVSSVTLQGDPVEHYQDDETLTLRFDPPLSPDTPHEVTIAYSCSNPYDGMTFTPSFPEAPQYTAEVHTHGETQYNSHWFPCHDFPNERLSTELIVNVPTGFAVCSNGRLVSTSDDGQRAVWHYLQEKPHVNYLVMLAIGKYDIVPLSHARIPMQVWVPQGLGHLVPGCYGRTGEMIDVMERRFGTPYPWDRYDQILVKNFGAGGMENTSATTMYPTAVLDDVAIADRDLEGLISHELAHQWVGDLVTCKSWAHIWLNEGFATYGSALWFEARDGQDGYLDSIRRNFWYARRDKTTDEFPMVSPVYENDWEPFRRGAYPKGASILHMLRMMLGDEIFFAGLQTYMNRYALDTVETDDFRRVMEEVSGLGLEWFFDQWCYRPGAPELNVDVRYDGKSRQLEIDVEQIQQIDERTPAFRFTLPVHVETDSRVETFQIDVRDRTATLQTVLDSPPNIVAIDPNLHVLKTMTVKKPQALWLNQARKSPTIAARHEAIGALGDIDTGETIELLSGIITDDSARHTIRQSAVRSLAKYPSRSARTALLSIIDAGVDDPKVRLSLVRALEDFEAAEVIDLLADIAAHDPSYAVKAAAINGLAHHKAADHADLIADLVHYPSQHDQVRQAALSALAELDDERGLELGIEYSAYGFMDRARPAAISAIGKLSHYDADRAVPYLIALLQDPEHRTANAAGKALADAGDKRAVDPISAIAETSPDPSLRKDAKGWLEKLKKGDADTKKQSDDEDD